MLRRYVYPIKAVLQDAWEAPYEEPEVLEAFGASEVINPEPESLDP